MSRYLQLCALTTLAVTVLVSCGLRPEDIPVPGDRIEGPTYNLRIEFANALNLPQGARVRVNGLTVGRLDSLSIAQGNGGNPGYVAAEVELPNDVRLPKTTTAELRQPTLLGDTYIALSAPSLPGPEIADDGVIPLSQTKSTSSIEQTMAELSIFVNGGAINRVEDITRDINAALPTDPMETTRIFEVLGSDVEDIARNLDDVDSFLNAAEGVTTSVTSRATVLDELLTPDGVTSFTAAVGSVVHVLALFGSMGNLAHGLVWLAPLAQAGNAAVQAFAPLVFTARPFDLDAPSNLNKLAALLREDIMPFATAPAFNVTAQTSPLTQNDKIRNMIELLRVVGVVR